MSENNFEDYKSGEILKAIKDLNRLDKTQIKKMECTIKDTERRNTILDKTIIEILRNKKVESDKTEK